MASQARRVAPLAALAAVGLAALGLAQTGPGRDALADLGVSTPAEPYTELALARPAATPAVSGGVLTLPLWIRNAEGGSRTYEWTATTRTRGADAATTAATGTVALADGAATTLAARIPVACAGVPVRVDVTLGGPHRTVGVWVPCGGEAP